MAAFLHTLLILTALGSALTVLLLLAGPLLKSRTAAYYLWLLVLVRLCLPVGVTLPLPVGVSGPAAETAVTLPVGGAALTPAEGQASGSPAREDTPVVGQVAEGERAQSAQTKPAAGMDWRRVLTGPELWFALWAAGAVFCLGRQVWGFGRFSRLVRESGEAPEPEALALLARLDGAGQVGLTVCPYLSIPILLGVFRPLIVLPRGVEGGRLEDILRHELVHARRHDLLYKWFGAVVTGLHWFNPLMLVVRRQLSRACELSCDGAVVRGMDAAARRHYGETLLAMAAARPPRGAGMLAATLCEQREHLKERLVWVMRAKGPGPAGVALTLALSILLAGCAAVFDAKPTPAAQQSPAPVSTSDALLSDPVLYDLSNGLTAALPADLADQLLVETPGEGEIFLSVFEKRSYEAGGGGGIEGMGWLFSIARYDQIAFEQTLGLDNSGRSFFARGDGWYYASLYPTDVRFYSESEPEEQAREFSAWEALNRRLPEETRSDFVARNGLEPFTSGDYFNTDGSLWEGEHCYVSYHTPDWSESITLYLSQPARQGQGGIWCVEGYFNNQIGGGALVLPRDTGMLAADYYSQLQRAADGGQHTEVLTPEGAALAWLSTQYSGVTGDQLTRLEGEPAWNLWYREISPILSQAMTIGTQVYRDGEPTRIETMVGEAPYQPTLYTRLWVKAEAPDAINGPAVRYDAGEAGQVIFLESDGLVGVERDGKTAWYRGAYDYEESPYDVMAALCQAWKESNQAVLDSVYQGLAQVFEGYEYDVELYGFREAGSSPWVEYVRHDEQELLQQWLADCTWEEVEDDYYDGTVFPDPPSGCESLWLVGAGQVVLNWGIPYVTCDPWDSVHKTQYWHCTQGYEQLYTRLAGLWESKTADVVPAFLPNRMGSGDDPLVLRRDGEERTLKDPEAVARMVEGLTWTVADPQQAQGEGIALAQAGDVITLTCYPGNIVRYYREDIWTFWYQGTGETDLYEVLTQRWDGA